MKGRHGDGNGAKPPARAGERGGIETRATRLLGVRLPIVQGGLARVAFAELAAAVSNAGGLGQISTVGLGTPERLRAEIRRCRALTDKPFGVNLPIGRSDVTPLLEAALDPAGKPDAAKVAELAGKLDSEFGGTHYAQYGSLFVAKVAVEANRLDDAASALQRVLDKPADATLGELARQRLARVLAAQDKADDALKLLDAKVEDAFLASREELKGDLLVQLGRSDDAHAAYQKAKDALAEDAAVGGLQMKLDDLAKGDA